MLAGIHDSLLNDMPTELVPPNGTGKEGLAEKGKEGLAEELFSLGRFGIVFDVSGIEFSAFGGMLIS